MLTRGEKHCKIMNSDFLLYTMVHLCVESARQYGKYKSKQKKIHAPSPTILPIGNVQINYPSVEAGLESYPNLNEFVLPLFLWATQAAHIFTKGHNKLMYTCMWKCCFPGPIKINATPFGFLRAQKVCQVTLLTFTNMPRVVGMFNTRLTCPHVLFDAHVPVSS